MSNELVAFVRARQLVRVHAGGGDETEDITVHEVARVDAAAWLDAKRREGFSIDPKLYAGLYFVERNPDGTPGQPQKIAEYFAVSEDKLKALPAEKLAELRDNGALGQIYAHLVSLLGWDRLIAKTLLRAAQTPVAANA